MDVFFTWQKIVYYDFKSKLYVANLSRSLKNKTKQISSEATVVLQNKLISHLIFIGEAHFGKSILNSNLWQEWGQELNM